MSTVDIFQMMTRRWAMGDKAELHNVRVVDVTPGPGVFETLTVEHQGARRPVVSGGHWNDTFSPSKVGKIGHLVRASASSHDDMPPGACYFRDYPDQSLRRVPELDDLNVATDSSAAFSRVPLVVGWRCDHKPEGFRAPLGIIPGQNGNFFPDETEAITVRVPPEFVRECRQVGRTAAEVLHGFIADLAGAMNYVVMPRADGFSSHGSDERMHAETWLERTYGMDRVPYDSLEQAEYERQEKEELHDDLASYLSDYLTAGGSADEFMVAVAALVDKKEAGGAE